MILIALLETIGGALLVFAFMLYSWRQQGGDHWKVLQAAERKEGDTSKAIAVLLFIGGLMTIAGIALAAK